MSFLLSKNNALAHKCEQIGTTWVWWLVIVSWDEEGKITNIKGDVPHDVTRHWSQREIRTETELVEEHLEIGMDCPSEIMEWRRK